MKTAVVKTIVLKTSVLFLAVLFFTVYVYAVSLMEKKLKIVVTTSHFSGLITEICKNKVELKTLIPASLCPETFDIDAKTIKEVSQSNAVLYHYRQSWVKNLKYKISKFGIVYREIKIKGNFMVPEINLTAAKEFTDLFSVWDEKNKDFYEKNFVDYKNKVTSVSEKILKDFQKFNGTKIVCNRQISPFFKWLGMDVAAEYETSSDISAADMVSLTRKIKQENICYIADNLQSGTDIGRILSEELKINHIVISNFPLANSYINTLKSNAENILNKMQE